MKLLHNPLSLSIFLIMVVNPSIAYAETLKGVERSPLNLYEIKKGPQTSKVESQKTTPGTETTKTVTVTRDPNDSKSYYKYTGLPLNYVPQPWPFEHQGAIVGSAVGAARGTDSKGHRGHDIYTLKAQSWLQEAVKTGQYPSAPKGSPIFSMGRAEGFISEYTGGGSGTTRFMHQPTGIGHYIFHSVSARNRVDTNTKGSIIAYESTYASESKGRAKDAGKDMHIHFQTMVPNKYSSSVRYFHAVNANTSSSNGVEKELSKGTAKKVVANAQQGAYVTDPTPYFTSDIKFQGFNYDAGIHKSTAQRAYLGGTIRCRFNRLYGAALPTMEACNYTKALPEVVIHNIKGAGMYQSGDGSSQVSPETLAALNSAALDAAITAGQAGYNIDGAVISSAVLASHFLNTDGEDDFLSLSIYKDIHDAATRSPRENIHYIGTLRYGNAEWEAQVQKMSSKALLSELLVMRAQRNFLLQQKMDIKLRIEQMLAALNATKLTGYTEKITNISQAIQAKEIPRIIDGQLEKSGDEYNITGYGPTTSTEAPTCTPEDKSTEASINQEAASVGVSYKAITDVGNNNLVTLGSHRVHKMVRDPLVQMLDAARKDGVNINIISAYRSKEIQAGIISAKKRRGLELLEIYRSSAPAGHSEHHTGLALDFGPGDNSLLQSFANTKQYRWLKANAAKYGFYESYQKTSSKTASGQWLADNGTLWEPWHWSYRGSEEAKSLLNVGSAVSSKCSTHASSSNGSVPNAK